MKISLWISLLVGATVSRAELTLPAALGEELLFPGFLPGGGSDTMFVNSTETGTFVPDSATVASRRSVCANLLSNRVSMGTMATYGLTCLVDSAAGTVETRMQGFQLGLLGRKVVRHRGTCKAVDSSAGYRVLWSPGPDGNCAAGLGQTSPTGADWTTSDTFHLSWQGNLLRTEWAIGTTDTIDRNEFRYGADSLIDSILQFGKSNGMWSASGAVVFRHTGDTLDSRTLLDYDTAGKVVERSILSRSRDVLGIAPIPRNRRNLDVRVSRGTAVFRNPSAVPVSVSVSDLQGRTVEAFLLPPSESRSLPLRRGLFLWRASGPQGRSTGSLPPAR